MNEANVYKFVTRKWNIVADESNTNCNWGNGTAYNTKVLESNLWDYNHACILERGDIIIVGDNGDEVAFKNCPAFIKCIIKNWCSNNRLCWRFRFDHINV